MKLVDQWRTIEKGLPADWEEVRLVVTTEQPEDLPRAAQVLAPMNAGKVGSTLVLDVRRGGGVQGPESARRLFIRLDESRAWAFLEQGLVRNAQAATLVADEAVPVAVSWERALAPLPPDWTDLLCELELDSSDYLDPAALLCAPLNPTRDRERLAFLFRCAGRAGYGASRTMVRRCCERLDGVGITGATSVLSVLSDTDDVATQGPVWRIDGRAL